MAHIIESQIYNINKVIIQEFEYEKDIKNTVLDYLCPKYEHINRMVMGHKLHIPFFEYDDINCRNDDYFVYIDNEKKSYGNLSYFENVVWFHEYFYSLNINAENDENYDSDNEDADDYDKIEKYSIYMISGETDTDNTRKLFLDLKQHIKSNDYEFFTDTFICSFPEEVL